MVRCPTRRRRRVVLGRFCAVSFPLVSTALLVPRHILIHRASKSSRLFVLTTPESIIEQASTTKLLDDLIDESVRTSARRPFILQFDPSSGWIWRRWKGTVFSETWDSCVYRMIYASIVYFVCSQKFPQIAQSLTGINTLWSQLLSVTTFSLTFFVNQSYSLWRRCSELSRRLQGRLHDLDMSLAAHAARKQPSSPNDPSTYTAGAKQVLELVSRFVRLFNLLTYASFTRSHRPILTPRGMRRLVERGLMTPMEREILVEAEIPATQRHNAVLLWILRSFIEAKEAGHVIGDAGFEQQFLEKAHVLRSSYGAIGDELQGRMPLAYAHIVQVLVDIVLWMYPLMAWSSGTSALLTVLGTGLLTMGYQGLFDLAKQFLDPYDNENFGKGEDPLVVDTLIAETNAGSIRWMNGLSQMPVAAYKFKNSEMSDLLLPVRGYTVDELFQMEEEKRELQTQRENEEMERQRVEAYERRIQEAAEAMIPTRFESFRSLERIEPEIAYVMMYKDTRDSFYFPGKILSSSFPIIEEVAQNVLFSQNVNSTGLQRELIPAGTSPGNAYVTCEVSLSVEGNKAIIDDAKNAESPHIFFSPHLEFDENDDKDTFEASQDWEIETQYVHQFDSFDQYAEFPSFDEVGADGEEIRMSQILADDDWEEEIEYKKEISLMRSYSENVKNENASRDAAARELKETEEILSASADARERARLNDTDNGIEAPIKQYDQLQLDGISQLFGLPPNVLSELPEFEENTAPYADIENIQQLWGGKGMASPSQVPSNISFDSFNGISELWGEQMLKEGDEIFLISPLERVKALDQAFEDSSHTSRLSEVLAKEEYGGVDGEEFLSDQPLTLKDYERQVQEILEAEHKELLETEAIMNARPAAEDIAVTEKKQKGDDIKAEDDLAALEMDAENYTLENNNDDRVENGRNSDSDKLLEDSYDADSKARL